MLNLKNVFAASRLLCKKREGTHFATISVFHSTFESDFLDVTAKLNTPWTCWLALLQFLPGAVWYG